MGISKDLQGLLPSPVFANENRCFEDSLGEEGMALSCSKDGYFPVLQFLCTQDVYAREMVTQRQCQKAITVEIFCLLKNQKEFSPMLKIS